jgi:hypothetical protein
LQGTAELFGIAGETVPKKENRLILGRSPSQLY